MRYPSGTCTHCPAQTEHISGGYIHSDTHQVHSLVNGDHVAAPSFDVVITVPVATPVEVPGEDVADPPFAPVPATAHIADHVFAAEVDRVA